MKGGFYNKLAQSWRDREGDGKAQFFRDNVGKFDQDLRKVVEDSVAFAAEQPRNLQFKGAGTFLRAKELEEKYEAEPEILANIYNNAQSFIHPDKGVRVWQDRDFAASDVAVSLLASKAKLKEGLALALNFSAASSSVLLGLALALIFL